MCEYCDLKRQDNGNHYWRKSGKRSGSFYLEQESKLNSETGEEYDVKNIELVCICESCDDFLKINYCPFCGTRLNEKE